MVIGSSIGQQSFSPTSWLESRFEGNGLARVPGGHWIVVAILLGVLQLRTTTRTTSATSPCGLMMLWLMHSANHVLSGGVRRVVPRALRGGASNPAPRGGIETRRLG